MIMLKMCLLVGLHVIFYRSSKFIKFVIFQRRRKWEKRRGRGSQSSEKFRFRFKCCWRWWFFWDESQKNYERNSNKKQRSKFKCAPFRISATKDQSTYLSSFLVFFFFKLAFGKTYFSTTFRLFFWFHEWHDWNNLLRQFFLLLL